MKKNRVFERLYRLWLSFSVFACMAALIMIAAWLFLSGAPMWKANGLYSFIFSSEWSPASGSYGTAAMAAASAVTALASALISTVAAVGAACFLRYFCPEGLSRVIIRVTSVAAGLPSVLFGLVCMTAVVPSLGDIAPISGGACTAAAVIVLSLMLMPSLSVTAFGAIGELDRRVILLSSALGAAATQTVFGCTLPLLRSVNRTLFQNAFLRAAGEATAVLLVSGGVVGWPYPFAPTRTLAGTVVLEMGYAYGEHRSALFAIGALLLVVTALFPSGDKPR